MRAPEFWWRERPGAVAHLLAPLGLAYGAVSGRRMGREGVRAARPVVCVGNVTVGGAGKTPTALALAALLREMGETPVFLSRGHGGQHVGPLVVDPARHGAAEVGDEPLLLAAAAPTIVARDRVAGASLAVETGASVVVMDDGLQNPGLVKDLALAVVDSGTGLGNGLVLPAGPLRAPMARQWPRIDALVVVGEGRPGETMAVEARGRGLPVLAARLVPDPIPAAGLRGVRVLAFAGIGRPQKFFATLAALGAVVAARHAFPDHHRYTPRDVARLAACARREGLRPVTTAKDAVRLVGLAEGLPGLVVLPVTLAFDEPDAARGAPHGGATGAGLVTFVELGHDVRRAGVAMDATAAQTQAERLAGEIADAIVAGELSPGSRLDEQALAERYGVSRTPVREALRQLGTTGLIALRPRRGALVTEVTPAQLEELFVAMGEIEATCARLSALAMSPIERRSLGALHDDMGALAEAANRAGYAQDNAAFHTALYAGSHNGVLADFAVATRRRLQPYRRAQFKVPGRLLRSHEEHAAVVDAILRGDALGAHAAMLHHVSLVEGALDDLIAHRGRILVR